MAEIFPFPALRYDPEKVRLGDVVTQPYDKITPEMQAAYYQASPYNLVRIILNRPERPETAIQNRYTEAAESLRSWRKAGILRQDSPSIYAYSQRFSVPGTSETAERRSFIAAGRLYDYSEKIVYRHEQTLAKPKSDRLNLLRATRAHFGQIFMLYSDPAQTIESILFSDDHFAWQEVTDEYGVLHRVRRLTDPATLNIVKTEMADRKLIIADGHHRYETALNFRNEVAGSTNQCLKANAERAMMTFVNMDSPGLVLLPTHRVIFGLKDFSPEAFVSKAAQMFDVSRLHAQSSQELVKTLAQAGTKRPSFIAATKGGCFLLLAKPGSESQIEDCSPERHKLDVVQLHCLLLEKTLGISREQILNQQHVRYLRGADEALSAVNSGPEVNVAFLVNPASIEQVRQIAFAGEVLPQKSTDFYPKMLSGLTIFALEEPPQSEDC